MQIISTNSRQFSLRGLFFVMTLVALFVGMHVRKVREYKAAILQLRERGMGLGCTHPNALGPDFLYSWEFLRIPLSVISAWYHDHLSIEAHDMALVRDTTVTKADIQLLAKVPFAYGISIHNSRFEPEAIATMAESCLFVQAAFVDTPLTIDEHEQLTSMTCLSKIWLLGTSQLEEGIAKLRQKLPNCEIALK